MAKVKTPTVITLTDAERQQLRLVAKAEQAAKIEAERVVMLAKAALIGAEQAKNAYWDALSDTYGFDPTAEFTFDDRAGTLTPKG
jgi:hypothetical protein